MPDDMKIVNKDPAILKLHPLQEEIFRWHPLRLNAAADELDQVFKALVEDIRENGIQQPLLIDEQDRLLDGADRWLAARRLQLPLVPTIMQPKLDIEQVLGHLVTRKNYTESQIAMILAAISDATVEANKKARLANLKNQPLDTLAAYGPASVHIRETLGFLAEKAGISTRLLYQAREIRKLFREHPQKFRFTAEDAKAIAARDVVLTKWGGKWREFSLREYYEPLIFAREEEHALDPYGLGAVLAGLKSKIENTEPDGSTKPQRQQGEFDLAWDGFEKFSRNAARLDVKALEKATREELAAAMMRAVERGTEAEFRKDLDQRLVALKTLSKVVKKTLKLGAKR